PHQPTLSILTKEVFKDPNVCNIVVDQFPTLREMIQIEALTDDCLAGKMSVLHCLMMSHGEELLARYRGLLKSHLGDEFSRVQGELFSLAANAGFERGLRMDRTQEHLDASLKKISHFVPEAQVILTPKTTRIYPSLTRESIVTLVSSSLEFPSNDVPSSFVAVVVEQPSLKQNE
nr:hypothetical protein [Tanacetum cinerariifolium]